MRLSPCALGLWLIACGAEPAPLEPLPESVPTPTTAARTAPPLAIADPMPVPDLGNTFEPRSVTLGTMALLSERCTVAGDPLEALDAFDAVRAIAWTGEAAVYLLDADGLLRRYLDVGDEACVLTPDGAFGDGGALALGAAGEDRPRSLAVDAAGHLYASAPLAGTHRLTGDHVDYRCETRGRVAVSPSGAVGFGLFGTGPAQRIAFTESGCTVTDWAPSEAPSILESVSFVADDRVLLGGQRGREGPHTARLYDLEGQPLEPAFGTEDASAPDRLCYTHAALPCGEGLCVLDGNCRALVARRADGTIVGRAELSELTGLSAPWIVPPVRIEHGMTFFAAAQPEIRADGTRYFAASIFRLHGL